MTNKVAPVGIKGVIANTSTKIKEKAQETKEKWDEFSSYISGNAIVSGYNGVITSVELSEGDSVYFDSGVPHAEKALDGKKARFLAVVMK